MLLHFFGFVWQLLFFAEATKCPRVPNCTAYEFPCVCRGCDIGYHLKFTSLPPQETRTTCIRCADCHPGFERVACTSFSRGTCVLAPCPPNSTWNGTQCACEEMFEGTITASVSSPFFLGSCTPKTKIRRHPKTSGPGPSSASKSSLPSSSLAALAPTSSFKILPRLGGSCTIPNCLNYNTNCSCTNCSLGYYLNNTPAENTTCAPCQNCPAWEYAANCSGSGTIPGTCTNVSCPALSQWNGSWCVCNSGYRGNLRFSPEPPYVIGFCSDINE